MNAWKIIYIMAQWLVFITAYNRPLEAIPVFIEINVGLRPWCLCCRCKLWNRENNLMACPALEFHPFRVRAASGSSPCSLPFRLALFKLGSCLPWWSCHGAQQLRFVELHPKQLMWKQRYQEKALPKSEGVELYLIASHDVVRYI